MRHDILSPKRDIVFRAVFRRPEVLRPFLAAVLGVDVTEPQEIRVADPRWRENADSKEIVFDILAVLADGTRVVVEMQMRNQPAFRGRGLFYLARLAGVQLKAGEGYEGLRKSVCVIVTDFVIFGGKPGAHSCFQMRDRDGRVFSDLMELHVIELPKGAAAVDSPAVAAWIALLNCETRSDLMEVARMHPETAPAAKAILALDEDEALRWELDMADKARRDAADREAGARAEGEAEGEARGVAMGLAQGRAEGEARGVARGRAEGEVIGARKTARNLLKMGLDPASIAKATDLPLEEVLALAGDPRRDPEE